MNKLRELREAKGLTQEKLAEITGISRVSISNLETGAVLEAKISTLKKLAEALDVKVSFFLS